MTATIYCHYLLIIKTYFGRRGHLQENTQIFKPRASLTATLIFLESNETSLLQTGINS
jgi:hypothetical protein